MRLQGEGNCLLAGGVASVGFVKPVLSIFEVSQACNKDTMFKLYISEFVQT